MTDVILKGMSPSSDGRTICIVGLGEALFDCFPSHTLLGGAPVNLSVHANALLNRVGGIAMPASRVGDDDLGRRFFAELRSRHVSCEAVQIDPTVRTGRVVVSLDRDRQATYRFESQVAWDCLELTSDWETLARGCHAVAFGTLAQRCEPSRSAIRGFLRSAEKAIRLFDVNLRANFYDAEIITESLTLASAAKLNCEELGEVLRLLGLSVEGSMDSDVQASLLVRAFELDWLALTRGSKGTVLYQGLERFEDTSESNNTYTPAIDSDSVGSGDACCAALLVGMALDWPLERTLQLANAAGAYVAGQPGATPQLPDSILDLVGARPVVGTKA